ncbi:uncharacterized protein [Argopecten irradians]|uniref:uncharacterized protein n=1 Tax=Argopecten irradians TaxID=31199 RepID=UPI0037126188
MEAFGDSSIFTHINGTENQCGRPTNTCTTQASDGVSARQNLSTIGPYTIEDDILMKTLEVLQHANYILLPTMLVFGLFGNTLTIIIMTSRRYAHLTSRLLLIALACSDMLLLLTQPFNKIFFIWMTGLDLRALSDIGCKIYFFLFRSSKMTSSWFVVLLCVERFIAVWFPFRAKIICTQRNTLLSIGLVYVVIGTYNSVWARWSSIVNGRCHPDGYNASDPEDKAMFGRFLIGGCNLYSFIPTAIMLVLTPLIIKKLLDHRRKRKTLTRKTNKQDEAKVTVMLLGIVTAYVILIIPVTFLHLFSFLIGVRAFGQNPNGFLIFRDVTQILEQVNYAINFVLYVITSQQFRGGLSELLCCRESHNSVASRKTAKNYRQENMTGSQPGTIRSKLDACDSILSVNTASSSVPSVCSCVPTPCSSVPTPGSSVSTPGSSVPTPCSSVSNFCSSVPTPCSKVPTPCSNVPTPSSSVPTPCSSVPTPCSSVPTPFSSVPTPRSSVPTPGSSVPTPCSSVPSVCSCVPTPCSSAPTPCSSVPTPFSSDPTPRSSDPTPRSSVPTPCSSAPTPCSSVPTPFSSDPTPRSSFPTPSYSVPTPSSSVSSFPTPSSSVPTLCSSVPTPSSSVPIPSSSFPTPSYSVPIPSYSVPIPSSSVPTPSSSVPTPSSSVPTPSSSVPTPSSSVPTPSSSVPTPSSSVPIPSSSVPTPSSVSLS